MHTFSRSILLALLLFQGVLLRPYALYAECQFCEEAITNCAYVWQNEEEFTEDVLEWCEDKEWWQSLEVHHFDPEQQGECSGPEPDPLQCRACGVTTECHELWDDGGCHEPCGGSGFAAILDEAIHHNDLEFLASLVLEEPRISFDDNEGVIRILSVCQGEPVGTQVQLDPQRASALRDELNDRVIELRILGSPEGEGDF